MPGSAYHRLGETVTLQLHLPSGGSTFSSSAAIPLAVYDVTGKSRTLLPGEQINIDTLFMTAFDNSYYSVPYQIEVDAGPSTAMYANGIQIAQVTVPEEGNDVIPVTVTYPAPEGFPIPVGYVPVARVNGVPSTSTVNVDISGTARITTVVDPPGYKTWQAGTTPGQTQGRNF